MIYAADGVTALNTSSPLSGSAFEWERTPNPAWVRRLAAMRPVSRYQTGLLIDWEPGYPWEPVQRWMVYETFPPEAIHPFILRQLEGPEPLGKGHACFGRNAYGLWCRCSRPRGKWTGDVSYAINLGTHRRYRKHGVLAVPCFVIQGRQGGHKYQWTELERTLSRTVGGPDRPPPAGDLPYAEPSERTWHLLSLFADPDLMAAYHGLVDFGMRQPGDLDPSDARMAAFAATQILKTIGLRAAEDADELTWALKKSDGPRRPSERDTTDYDSEESELLARTSRDLRATA